MSPPFASQKPSWNGSIKNGKRAHGSAALSPKKMEVGNSAPGMSDRQLPLYLKEIVEFINVNQTFNLVQFPCSFLC